MYVERFISTYVLFRTSYNSDLFWNHTWLSAQMLSFIHRDLSAFSSLKIKVVEKETYLGYVINTDMSDDDHIIKEIRNIIKHYTVNV